MDIQNNAKVIETIERSALFNYFEKLVDAKTTKVTLFSIFPHTAAANVSEARSFFMIENIACLCAVNSGDTKN
jgi:hypothetical protein